MQTTDAVATPLETKDKILQDCPADKKKETFLALTGLRAIAAYFVFFHHFPIGNFVVDGFDVQKELHIGVSVFFVLSGFLICYRYFDNLQWNWPWFKQYFQNRFARIYPLYFILCVASIALHQHFSASDIALNLTLTHGFFLDSFKFIEPSWTLTVEECFYASAPLIFLTGRRWLILPYLFMICLLPVVLNINEWLPIKSSFLKDTGFVVLYTFFGRFTEFFIGVFLGKLLLRNKLPQARGSLFTVIGSLGILAVIAGMALAKTPADDLGLFTPAGVALNNVVLPAFVAMLIYGLIKENTWARRLLSTPTAVLLGKSSYALYLVHLSFVSAKELSLVTALIYFVVFNIIAILLYKFIEHPLNDVIRKL